MNTPINRTTSFVVFFPFLTLVALSSFLNVLVRSMFPLMTPYICEELKLYHSEAGHLFLTLSIGFAIALFFSQFISSKISHQHTVFTSIFLTGIGLIISSQTKDFPTFRWALFSVGFFSGLFIPSIVAMIREIIPYRHLGKAFGIFATAQSLAFIIGPMIVQFFSGAASWRALFNQLGITCSCISMFLFFAFKRENPVKGERMTLRFVKRIFTQPSFWILMIFLCLANGLHIGVYNMTPDYFQRHHFMSETTTHRLIIAARSLTMLSTFLGGFFVDRFGLKHAIAFSLTLCGLLTLSIGAIPPPTSLIFFIIQSPMAACLTLFIQLTISTTTSPKKNAALVSLITPFGFLIGSGVIPQLLGLFADLNYYPQGFICFGLTAFLSGILFNIQAVYRYIELSQLKHISKI